MKKRKDYFTDYLFGSLYLEAKNSPQILQTIHLLQQTLLDFTRQFTQESYFYHGMRVGNILAKMLDYENVNGYRRKYNKERKVLIICTALMHDFCELIMDVDKQESLMHGSIKYIDKDVYNNIKQLTVYNDMLLDIYGSDKRRYSIDIANNIKPDLLTVFLANKLDNVSCMDNHRIDKEFVIAYTKNTYFVLKKIDRDFNKLNFMLMNMIYSKLDYIKFLYNM